MHRTILFALLVIGCEQTILGPGESPDTAPDGDADIDVDTDSDTDTETAAHETAPPAPTTLEYTCSGAETYFIYVPVDATPGEMPPRFAVWSHLSQDYVDYYESTTGNDYPSPQWWYVSQGGAIDLSGQLVLTCTCFDAATYGSEFCFYDQLIVVVE